MSVLADLQGEVPVRQDQASGALDLEDGTSLRWRLLGAPDLDDRLWTVWVDRPHDEDETLSWALTVRVRLEGGRTTIVVHLGLRSLAYELRPERFRTEPPSVVPLLTDELDVMGFDLAHRLLPDPAGQRG